MDYSKYYQNNEQKTKEETQISALESMGIKQKTPAQMDIRKDFVENEESRTKHRVIFYDMFHKESNK